MSQPLRVRSAAIHPLAMPMRLRFEHAAAARDVADPVVLRLTAEAPFAEHAGCGETLARDYVTGERTETVIDDLTRRFIPRLIDFRPTSFAQALEFLESVPLSIEGRIVTAARAAFELAIIDLAGRAFGCRAAELAGWLDLPGLKATGRRDSPRYSGIVVGRGIRKLSWLLRAQRWYGLRDFKIKVATPGWEERLATAHRVLRRAIGRGRATLRADANGAWTLDEALAALPTLARHGVCGLEQPLSKADDVHLAQLADAARSERIDLIADESLVTPADAERLVRTCGVRVLNIRLAKVGGLIPALRMADFALRSSADVQLGCLVGETSILTAAGAAFLELCPRVRFAEGAFGRLLLRGDVTGRPIRFGRCGRIRSQRGTGLGVDVAQPFLERWSARPGTWLNL
jgi:L-alanine-DL-glutamate epimerase-like enolase superfamily enzyme